MDIRHGGRTRTTVMQFILHDSTSTDSTLPDIKNQLAIPSSPGRGSRRHMTSQENGEVVRAPSAGSEPVRSCSSLLSGRIPRYKFERYGQGLGPKSHVNPAEETCAIGRMRPDFDSGFHGQTRRTGDGRRRTGDGGRRTGDGRRRTGDGGRRTGDGGRRTGDNGRRTGDGRRRTRDGGRRTGDGGRCTGDSGRRTGDGVRVTVDGVRETADGEELSCTTKGVIKSSGAGRPFRIPQVLNHWAIGGRAILGQQYYLLRSITCSITYYVVLLVVLMTSITK
ncbi:unnamed protein product [Nesidiocoris tenuis]|uniref:Uncharacterized protein n=1 Tax=Nesidiocoris tenuis TaxID=355587 RepID=A0A6H5HKC3_9HEMI|nr:unnamed protein product [Nesidiocoris tenuis]